MLVTEVTQGSLAGDVEAIQRLVQVDQNQLVVLHVLIWQLIRVYLIMLESYLLGLLKLTKLIMMLDVFRLMWLKGDVKLVKVKALSV